MPASSVSSFGIVTNPATTSVNDVVESEIGLGKQSQQLVDNLHGAYYNGAYRNQVFTALKTAQTIPVIAGTLVSVFSLWNPGSSRANLELISMDLGLVLATTVVDTVGLYWQNGATAAAATFTTIGVKGTNWFNARPSQPVGQGQFYSALTHSGTPARIKILSQFGATSSTNDSPININFNGSILLEPGDLVSIAMSTAASTSSGVDVQLTWQENPL